MKVCGGTRIPPRCLRPYESRVCLLPAYTDPPGYDDTWDNMSFTGKGLRTSHPSSVRPFPRNANAHHALFLPNAHWP